jgi:hypothetical protein
MKNIPAPRVLPRGRVAKWSREQLDKLSTDDLRALLDNARKLNETEVAALCTEILESRPRGMPKKAVKAVTQRGTPS